VQQKEDLRVLFDEWGSNKGLAGYNSPSAAKVSKNILICILIISV
jgi:hypothetical protein